MRERTLALVKSGALSRGQDNTVFHAALEAGLSIVIAERRRLSREQAEAFYAEHAGRPYFERLVASVTGSCGIIAMVLEGEGAIARWRAALGPTDPVVARETHPGSVRAQAGTELPDNAAHGSDSPESAAREMGLLFPRITPSDAEAYAAASGLLSGMLGEMG